MSALPATLINGLGAASVNGRMRVPSPAAKTMALSGGFSGIRAPVRFRARRQKFLANAPRTSFGALPRPGDADSGQDIFRRAADGQDIAAFRRVHRAAQKCQGFWLRAARLMLRRRAKNPQHRSSDRPRAADAHNRRGASTLLRPKYRLWHPAKGRQRHTRDGPTHNPGNPECQFWRFPRERRAKGDWGNDSRAM